MWRVYNEFSEIYTETRSEAEAERSARKINGFYRYEDTACDVDPFYDDTWMY